MTILYILLLVISNILTDDIKYNPLSDEFITYINNKQTSWIAGRNFNENTPIKEIKKMLGTRKTKLHSRSTKEVLHNEDISIPDSFDARVQWPECKSLIGTIADQSVCGSCWAVAAASAMSDRRCIASSGKLQTPVSAVDLMSCCYYCGNDYNDGSIEFAWLYWFEYGIVTGGSYNSSEGCKPYPFESCDHYTNGNKKPCSDLNCDIPTCRKQCQDSQINYSKDLTFAEKAPYRLVEIADIQNEILSKGPVEAGFEAYDDFLNYKSGVYQYAGGEYTGSHSVRIIGWGVENNIPYWLIANSWNEDWGDKGLFKIIRGQNEVGIEDAIFASVPYIPN